MRVAVIFNHGDNCGIATYTQYLIDSLRPKVDALKVFAEYLSPGSERPESSYEVEECWKRGHSMSEAMRKIKEWSPTVILIAHEYGIFPRANHWLRLLQDLYDIPYVVTLHSIYAHLDKIVCTSAVKNAVVHSQTGADCLKRLGHNINLKVIPHGCVILDNVQENWNIFQTPYTLFQAGFNFSYKGASVVLDAVAELCKNQPNKYGKGSETPIFYEFLASENDRIRHIATEQFNLLMKQASDLDILDHVAVIRGFQSEQVINQHYRTAKIAVFPYLTQSNNVVYGASGMIRIAMANGIPVIASKSHMFDDMEGVLPRPGNAEELAAEIDKTFSSSTRRSEMLIRQTKYIEGHSWDATAQKYLNFMREVS
jgi:glycosyltransferase involved in cell wall biosynthesis